MENPRCSKCGVELVETIYLSPDDPSRFYTLCGICLSEARREKAYTKELDIKVRDVINEIVEIVTYYFPEGEFSNDGWKAEIAQAIHNLVDAVLKESL